jgi:hypothetical protein
VQRGATKRDDDRLFFLAETGSARRFRSGLPVLNRLPLPPLCHRLGIDPRLPAPFRGRNLRSLYCCSDCVHGHSAAVAYLSHKASFHSNGRVAPPNPGIKQPKLDAVRCAFRKVKSIITCSLRRVRLPGRPSPEQRCLYRSIASNDHTASCESRIPWEHPTIVSHCG